MTDSANTDPALTAAVGVGIAEERLTLEAFLDNYRAVLKAKAAGLTEEQARFTSVPTGTSIGGLLKHLRWVEQGWFRHRVHGVPAADLPTPPWTDEDPDADFRLTDTDTLPDLIAAYDAQCEISRETAAAHDLTDTHDHPEMGEVSLRWVYLHMIEETARHAGQADILREQIDGTTGPEI
jgi:uncharacterized damage-inducible protein DinB